MISVAMTVFNGQKYLSEQLKSILMQTISADEVILVDDCSSDNSVFIIKEFINENNLVNWKLIELFENSGYKKSFNRAIEETNGDIIFLCDHDDIWLPKKIEIMSNVMKKTKGLLALNSSFIKVNHNNEIIKEKKLPYYSNNNLIRKKIKNMDCVKIDSMMVSTYNISPGCTLAFKSDLKPSLKMLDYDETNLSHDWKINFIASLYNGLYYLNVETIRYRLHDSNTLGLKRVYMIKDRIGGCKESIKDRNYMLKIIDTLYNDESINNDFNVISKHIKYLIYMYNKRINILLRKSSLRTLLNFFDYNIYKKRILDSIFVDLITILKSE